MKVVKKIGLAGFICISTLLLLFLGYDFFFPFQPSIAFAPQFFDRNGVLMHAKLSSDDKWRLKIDQKEIPQAFIEMLLFKEDRWFFKHPGINPIAVGRAMVQNLIRQKRFSGASTITMQTVRLLRPHRRTYFQKCLEMIQAFQLELHFSKTEILEMYLSLAPYGSNLEGLKAASIRYYGQNISNLSPARLTLLTLIPNYPAYVKNGKINPRLEKKFKFWLKVYAQNGLLPGLDASKISIEEVQPGYFPFPKECPHLVENLHQEDKNQSICSTSIDLAMQQKLEQLLWQYTLRNMRFGFSNGALLIAETQTGKVLAYLGSQKFDDKENSGEVDGCKAIRSPGSTLKPFLYQQALAAGLISPKLRLYDIPKDFEGYMPDNYDLTFKGMVSAQAALVGSLNIPAVELLNRVGVNAFVEKLETLGFKSLAPQKEGLGLSLAIGGCGVSMQELVQAYSCLARNGKNINLSFRNGAEKKPNQVLDAASAYLVSEMLARHNRTDLPSRFLMMQNLPDFAWKTGTSLGRKDAWCIGFNEHYTIGVWFGNFSGKGISTLSGVDFAAPFLCQVFHSLDPKGKGKLPQKPAIIKTRKVCMETGMPLGNLCQRAEQEEFIPLVSPNAICKHFNTYFADKENKMSWCAFCKGNLELQTFYYKNEPADFVAWKISNQIPIEKIPPHNPLCKVNGLRRALRIISPGNNKIYQKIDTDSVQLKFEAVADPDAKNLFWYLNNKWLRTTNAKESFFLKLNSGNYSVSCIDDKGFKSQISFFVQN